MRTGPTLFVSTSLLSWISRPVMLDQRLDELGTKYCLMVIYPVIDENRGMY